MATPTRPGTEAEIDDDTKRILLERDAIFDQEAKAAKPWREVKAEIIRQHKPLVPR